VDSLANCTAGGQIQFQSNSKRLAVHVKLPAPANMVHMPATGQCGFDLYIGPPGRQLYYSTTKYDVTQSEYKVLMFEHKKAELRNFTLNFPLYSGVNEVLIGLEPKARIQPPPPYTVNKPIVIYGTSITQGGCACRPGMAYTNILSRKLNMPVINLGFSGNGKGEPELARTINEIRTPSLLVLDYDANCVGNDNLARTLPEFIRIFRTVNKNAPILVITRIPPASELVQEAAARARRERIEIQRAVVTRLQKAGDKRLFFQDGSTLLGDDWHESTVDGSHPTDLGFQRMAEHLEPVIRSILF
jgi:lysophospholipase L1-like esterase